MPAIIKRTLPSLVIVNDQMQTNYRYERIYFQGENFDPEFRPQLTPAEMLKMGVFGGKYMTDCRAEFPETWFFEAKLSPELKDPSLNFFGVDASSSLTEWRAKGWIHEDDPRGWFQWYCRYFTGRRHADDHRQITRWKQIKRHAAQIMHNCHRGDMTCRPKQRQTLLHWAYDPRLL